MSERLKRDVQPLRLLKKLLAAPFVLIAALIILFEDWLWDDLARLAAAIGRLPILRSVEAFVVGLPPYAALAFFGAPSLLLIPVKLTALYFISHGQPGLGLLTAVVAKIAGTALVARIFTLTRPNLMRINWFAWVYERFITFKTRIYGRIKSTALYQAAHKLHLTVRAQVKTWFQKRKGFLRRRFAAALKLSRRRKQPQEGR
jgi:hypothetical protein